MQKLTITGITKDNPKSLVWGGLPKNAYLVIRNRTQDDSIKIVQTIPLEADEFGVVNYKEVTTPIKRGEEHSFYVEDSTLDLNVTTETSYAHGDDLNCITAIVLNNENLQKDNMDIFVVNLVNEKALVNNTTIENKGINYLQAVEFNVRLETIPQDEFPTKKTSTDTRLIQKTNYTSYVGAGRGYLLKNVIGMNQGTGSQKDTNEILKQVENYNHQLSGVGDSHDVKLETAEVPYIPKFVKADILAFDTEVKKVNDEGASFIEYPKVMGNAMFQLQVSKADAVSVLNNKTYSGITKIGTAYSPDDSTKEIYKELQDEEGFSDGYEGDPDDILDTRMWRVGSGSQWQWWQDRCDPQGIKFIAFTIQPTSQDYPYSVAFTAPLFGGITFLSDTSLKLHLGNRETLYNLKESVYYKVLRIVMNYEADYLQLYLNGEKIEHESQSATTFTNKETNAFGVDVKSAYSHTEQGINILASVLGAKGSLEITAETLKLNTDNDKIEPNDYTIKYKGKGTTSARVFVLPKDSNVSGKNAGIVPLGNITDNATRQVIRDRFFMWETDSSNITAMNFTADKTEDAIYAIGVDSSEPKIEIVSQSVEGVISVSFAKDKAMELYSGLDKYTSQTQGYRYKFSVKAEQTINATAEVKISWVDGTGATQSKTISITITEA